MPKIAENEQKWPIFDLVQGPVGGGPGVEYVIAADYERKIQVLSEKSATSRHFQLFSQFFSHFLSIFDHFWLFGPCEGIKIGV